MEDNSETTKQVVSETGTGMAGLSCPGSGLVAENAKESEWCEEV
jgi:hypothetical protein